VVLSAAASGAHPTNDDKLRDIYDASTFRTTKMTFPHRIGAKGDARAGMRKFGFAEDGVTLDSSQALFEGHSVIYGNVVSNGRTCASCHRRDNGAFLGMPALPLTTSVAPDDPLLTGLHADAQGDPDAERNLIELGLPLYRPGRFNPTLADDDPFKQVFFWRKSIRLVNTVFTFGFLNDGRTRDISETARGAIFSHTQEQDARFDDLANPNINDLAAFIEEADIHPPELRALLDPEDPLHDKLVRDPFYTVHPQTKLEKQGQKVFEKNCMTCHNMPNVFSNIEHQPAASLNMGPPIGHTFDIGVAQKNFHRLEFRRFDKATQQRVPVVLPLVKQDGTVVHHTVVDDVGLAAATGRYEDLHRFKVPQLRRIKDLGPYFHDGSMQTLEEVVDYFNSPDYNNSPDGRKYPIQMNRQEREALLAFLRIL
jgi:cytochrome c peroxidase